MINGEIPNTPSEGANPDAFLTGISDAVWPLNRRPVPEGAFRQPAWRIAKDVCLFNEVAMSRRALRFANGALALQHPKLMFERDPSNNQPTNMSVYMIQNSNQLIEEYMLLANYLVAQELLIKCGNAAFLRHHPVVDGESKNFKDLIGLANKLDFEINFKSSQGLQESIRRMSAINDESVMQVVTSVLLHQMKLAMYCVAGNLSEEEWKHYALNIPYYTHFTSPIRRYADVVVHRLLFKALTSPQEAATIQCNDLQMTRYTETAEQCNTMRLAAKTAQERSDAVYLAMFLVSNPRFEEGVVVGIGEKSFTVLISNIYVEERFFIDKMPGVQSTFDKDNSVLTLTKTNEDGRGPSAIAAESGPDSRGNDQGNKRRDRNTVTVEPELLKLQHLVDFSVVQVGIFSKVRVYVTGKKRPPVGVVALFVGPKDD
jgi:exoribonuclease R